MGKHNSYVYDDSKVDTTVFRREAMNRAFDTRDPGDTIIHFHPYDDRGQLCNEDLMVHEYYKKGVGKCTRQEFSSEPSTSGSGTSG